MARIGRAPGMDGPHSFSDEVQETALALIRQYGEDADVIATMQAAEFAASGDVEGLAAWDLIIACIDAMKAEVGAPLSSRVH